MNLMGNRWHDTYNKSQPQQNKNHDQNFDDFVAQQPYWPFNMLFIKISSGISRYIQDKIMQKQLKNIW